MVSKLKEIRNTYIPNFKGKIVWVFLTGLILFTLIFSVRVACSLLFNATYLFDSLLFMLVFLLSLLVLAKAKYFKIVVTVALGLLLLLGIFDTFILTKQLLVIKKEEDKIFRLHKREISTEGYRYIIKESENEYIAYTVNDSGIETKETSTDGLLWTRKSK